MDVPAEPLVPPGCAACDVLDVQRACDGLAARFSESRDGRSRAAQAGAYLFSIAERSLVTAAIDEPNAAHTAVEALNLFVAAQEHGSATWATRLVIHALRASTKAASPGGDALQSFVEEELRRARLCDDAQAEAAMLLSLAEVKFDQTCYEESLQLSEAARQIFHRLDDDDRHQGLGLCWMQLAAAQMKTYQFHKAQDSALRAMQLFDAQGGAHGAGRARLLRALGLAAHEQHAAVIAVAKEAIPLAQEAGDPWLLAGLLYLLACSCYQKGGRFQEAAQVASEAAQLFLELGGCHGFAEMSLAVKVKALAESSQHLALLEALQQHRAAAALTGNLRRCLLMRDIWVDLLKRSDTEVDLQKAHAICDKSLTALRNASPALMPTGDFGAWHARQLELISSLHLKVNRRKKVEEALKWAQQAKQQLRSCGQKYLEADGPMLAMANCHTLLGEQTKAAEVLSERRSLFRELGARSREAQAMLELADALCREQVSRVDSRARRFLRDSFQICQEALNAFSDVGHATGMAKAHLLLADIYLYRQEPEEAEKEARQAEQLYRQAGEAKLVAKAVRKVGLASCERDAPREAARNASEAVVFCKKAGDRYALAEMLGWEAQMHSQDVGKEIEGLPEKEAQKIVFRSLSKLMTPAKEAVLLARKLQDKGLIATTLCSVGEVEASVGKWDAALCATAEAAQLSQKLSDRTTESRALVLSSEIHFRQKDFSRARDEAERAFKLVKNTFSWEARRKAEKALKRSGGHVMYDETEP